MRPHLHSDCPHPWIPHEAAGVPPTIVNDIHSKLNETTVSEVVRPRSVADVQDAVRRTRAKGGRLAIAGGCHSMGGQQFLTGGTLLDMRSMSRVLGLDRERGTVDVEAGILWSDLVPKLRAMQADGGPKWSIVQKQTGADRLSVGGAIAANGHGRGLRLPAHSAGRRVVHPRRFGWGVARVQPLIQRGPVRRSHRRIRALRRHNLRAPAASTVASPRARR